MTVKTSLKKALLNWSYIYSNAFDVYHHWFCVIGNGYEWKDGQLTSYDNVKETSDVKQAISNEIDNWFDTEEFRKAWVTPTISSAHTRDFNRSSLKECISKIINWEQSQLDFTNTREDRKIYPLCQYSKIIAFPDDITQDWLGAIEDFTKILSKSKLTKEDRYWLSKAKERIKSLKK